MNSEPKISKEEIEKASKLLRGIAEGIEEVMEKVMGRRMGFALMMFEFGEVGRANYISNVKREDMRECLKEALAKIRTEADNTNDYEVFDDYKEKNNNG